MNEYGDSEPTEQIRPEGGPWQQVPPPSAAPRPEQAAPTWQWTGAQSMSPPPVEQQPMGGWAGPPMPPMMYAPPARNHPSRRLKIAGSAAALLLVGGAAAGGAAFGFAHSNNSSSAAGIADGGSSSQGQTPQQTPPSGNTPQTPPKQNGNGRASRFATPGHATESQSVGVVDIYTKLKYQGASAAGTGMILTSTGEILTNNHVISGATKIKVVVVSTGEKYAATVVGTDKVDDVAVLQLTGASGLSTITPDTDPVAVGDAVTAVGNAMGAGGVPSAAEGKITGLNRSITTQSEAGVDGERLTGMIEVDAQVIAGDSGGPLYDAEGEVLGMDTAASSSPAQSTGFAIPIARALSIAEQIENGDEGGNISIGTPAFLGVSFSEGVFNQTGNGAVISNVLPKTPAADAGIATGDTIKSVDGTAITSGSQLHTVLGQYDAGDSVSVTWTDTRGTSHTKTITLIAGPAE